MVKNPPANAGDVKRCGSDLWVRKIHPQEKEMATHSSILFFKYKFIYLNWRLITLQYCIGFAIHQHESATGVHMFPIMNPPPRSLPIPSLWVILLQGPKHPVSCIEPGLVVRFTYDIIHVSVPFSQSIPLLPSPTESKRLFYTCVSFAISHTGLSLPSF